MKRKYTKNCKKFSDYVKMPVKLYISQGGAGITGLQSESCKIAYPPKFGKFQKFEKKNHKIEKKDTCRNFLQNIKIGSIFLKTSKKEILEILKILKLNKL